MKRFLIMLTMFVMLFSLVSCGKGSSIIGTWGFGVNTIEFRNDNTVSLSINGTLNYDGTYTVEEDRITITAKGLLGDVTEEFTYSLEADKLTLNGDITLMGSAPVSIDFTRQADSEDEGTQTEKEDAETPKKKGLFSKLISIVLPGRNKDNKAEDTTTEDATTENSKEKKGFFSKLISFVFPGRDKGDKAEDDKTEDAETEETGKKGFFSKLFSSIFPGKKKGDKEAEVKDEHKHEYAAATCSQPETCSCGETKGEPLSHTYLEGYCTVCGDEDPAVFGIQDGIVTGVGVRVRGGPGLEYGVIYHSNNAKTEVQLVSGHPIKVYGEKIKSNDVEFAEWYKIGFVYDGVEYQGYMASNYVSITPVDESNPDAGTHEHYFIPQIKREATCKADGEKTYTCSCGYSYMEIIGKNENHDWEDATCTKPMTCKDCKLTEGSANGHRFSSDGKCNECGEKNPAINQTVATCSLTAPSLPKGVIYYGYDDVIYTTAAVTKVTYKFDSDNDGRISLEVSFFGQKAYDHMGEDVNSSCRIGWKLYGPDGAVVKIGEFDTIELSVGDSFNQKVTVFDKYDDFPAGSYRIEVIDVK